MAPANPVDEHERDDDEKCQGSVDIDEVRLPDMEWTDGDKRRSKQRPGRRREFLCQKVGCPDRPEIEHHAQKPGRDDERADLCPERLEVRIHPKEMAEEVLQGLNCELEVERQ